jgi:hypothetical protein
MTDLRFSFYVNRKSKIATVTDLKGKKVGSPEWAHSAAVYMRGWRHNEMGVALIDVHWYQAGDNAHGRVEKVELTLPKGLNLTRVPDKSLSEIWPGTRSTAPSSRGALHPPAGHRAPPDDARGDFSEGPHDESGDLRCRRRGSVTGRRGVPLNRIPASLRISLQRKPART